MGRRARRTSEYTAQPSYAYASGHNEEKEKYQKIQSTIFQGVIFTNSNIGGQRKFDKPWVSSMRPEGGG